MDKEKLTQLGDQISNIPPLDSEGEEIEAMLLKYVVVAEWIDPDGSRYMTRRAANTSGDGLPTWEYRGLLHEALYGQW